MKATFSWLKNTLFCSQFSPQNTENRILRVWNFAVFWGSTTPDPLPLEKKGITATYWYSQLLYSNLLVTSIFIEIPDTAGDTASFFSVLWWSSTTFIVRICVDNNVALNSRSRSIFKLMTIFVEMNFKELLLSLKKEIMFCCLSPS